jgi:hypothetical protein
MCEVNMQVNIEFDNEGRLVRAENMHFIWKRLTSEKGAYGYGSLTIIGSDVVREEVGLDNAITIANEIVGVAQRLRNKGL